MKKETMSFREVELAAEKWTKLQQKVAEIDKNRGAGYWEHDRREEVFIATLTAMGYKL